MKNLLTQLEIEKENQKINNTFDNQKSPNLIRHKNRKLIYQLIKNFSP